MTFLNPITIIRICDKLLDKLLESVGKEMEKSIDSYVENLYAAEFETQVAVNGRNMKFQTWQLLQWK